MRTFRVLAVAAILLTMALMLRGSIPQVPTGTWKFTDSLTTVRNDATATLLPDGRILFVGGRDAAGNPLASAELFNTDGTFTSTPSPMSTARYGHAAILLPDSGYVLVTGGTTTGGGAVNSAEIFDTVANSWTSLTESMVEGRAGHTMSLLPNYQVLIAGGENTSGPLKALEVFDLSSMSFKQVGAMTAGRKGHAAAALADGRVLIAGGTSVGADHNPVVLDTTEIFNPATGAVTAGPAMSTPRAQHTATTLLDGTVAIIGGNDGTADLSSAEIYDPATDAIAPVASLMTTARSGHQAFLLPNNNNVVIVGGTSAGQALAAAELYTPWTGTFAATASMSVARNNASGSALAGDETAPGVDGVLVVAGGAGQQSGEAYGFATVKTDKNDYMPGETVTISGRGWQPGEKVTLDLREVSGVDSPGPFTATADAEGNIANTDFVPDSLDLNVRFYVTAIGSSGVQAQNTFKDAYSLTLTPNNGPTGTSVTVTTGGRLFVNGAAVVIRFDTTTMQGTCNANNGGNVPAPQTSCTFTVPSNAATGDHTVFATQQGDTTRSVSATFTVQASKQGTTTTVVSSANPSTYGQSVTFAANVTSASGSNTPSGTVDMKDGSTTVCTTGALSGASGTATASCSVSTLSAAVRSVTAVYGGDTNFTGSTSAVLSQTVNPKTLTVTGITAGNKPYDGNTTATLNTAGAGLSGVISPDAVTLDASGATGGFGDKNVGAAKTVTISGLSLTGTSAANYQLPTPQATTTANITAKTLTVTGITASNKPYDGNTIATLNTAEASLTGLVSPDVVDLNASGAVGAFADKNVGTAKTVAVSGLSLSGTGAGNYELPTPQATTTANITAKTLTVTGITASNKPYDGNTTATLNTAAASLSGVVSPDAVDLNVSGATGVFADKNVGTAKTVTVSGLSLSGMRAGNYELPTPQTTTTANINALHITGGFTAENKMYDGATSATVLTRSVKGAIAGDEVSLTGGTATFADKNIGTDKAVTLSNATLAGGDSGNYLLDSVDNAKASITAKDLTVTATGVNREYDGTTGATVTLADDRVTGDAVTDNYTTAAFLDKNVGTAKTVNVSDISITGSDAGNYNLKNTTATTTANITQKPASVTPIASSKTYGSTDPAFTGTLSGFVAGDGISVTYSRVAGEAVLGGPYSISATLTPAAALTNYDIKYNTASFTINAKPASVTPNDASKVFGLADPAPLTTGTLTGFLAADGVTAAYSRGAGESVRTYTITATLSPTAVLSNYNITYGTAVFTIQAWTLSGFYQPVTMTQGYINTVKAGSTVPLKFNMSQGSTNLTDTAQVKSFTVQQFSCSAIATMIDDPIDFTTTGGTVLRYDGIAGQFIQNWQTTPKMAGLCYTVTMTAKDGSTIPAYFKLK